MKDTKPEEPEEKWRPKMSKFFNHPVVGHENLYDKYISIIIIFYEIQQGDFYVTNDCSRKYTCVGRNQVEDNAFSCKCGEQCRLRDGRYQCESKLIFFKVT